LVAVNSGDYYAVIDISAIPLLSFLTMDRRGDWWWVQATSGSIRWEKIVQARALDRRAIFFQQGPGLWHPQSYCTYVHTQIRSQI